MTATDGLSAASFDGERSRSAAAAAPPMRAANAKTVMGTAQLRRIGISVEVSAQDAWVGGGVGAGGAGGGPGGW